MDEETLNGWKKSVEATNKGEGAPSFDEVCQKAGLTDEQIILLSTFSASAKQIIQVRNRQLCREDQNGRCSLLDIAEKLVVLHGENVSGRRTRFVNKMFGTHALLQMKEIRNGVRMRSGSDELWSTYYELDLLVDFVGAGYSVELEPELKNGKKPEFLVRKEAKIYVEAKRLDYDRQMDIVFGDDPWATPVDGKSGKVTFTKDKELALENMVSRNLQNASSKFDNLNVPHMIFILSLWPPSVQGNAIPSAITKFLSEPRPGLLGVAVENYQGSSFWTNTPKGIAKTDYAHGNLPPVLI